MWDSDEKKIEFLLKKGAKPLFANKYGISILDALTARNQTDAIKHMLRYFDKMVSAGAKQTLNTKVQLKDAETGTKDEQAVSTEETETLINDEASSTDFEAGFK
jgi:hypothetical protein